MEVTLIETTTLNGVSSSRSEKLSRDDLHLELLKSRNSANQWGILGYYYTDKCGQTKYGYKVTEYNLFSKDGKEIINRKFLFN